MICSFLSLPFWPGSGSANLCGSGSDQGKNMRIRADPHPDPKPWIVYLIGSSRRPRHPHPPSPGPAGSRGGTGTWDWIQASNLFPGYSSGKVFKASTKIISVSAPETFQTTEEARILTNAFHTISQSICTPLDYPGERSLSTYLLKTWLKLELAKFGTALVLVNFNKRFRPQELFKTALAQRIFKKRPRLLLNVMISFNKQENREVLNLSISCATFPCQERRRLTFHELLLPSKVCSCFLRDALKSFEIIL